MTSSRLFSNSRILDLKRDILWPIAYSILLFFSIPIAFLFSLPDAQSFGTYENGMLLREAVEKQYLNNARNTLGMGYVTFILMFIAAIEAYHAFGYLHRARELDFCHSLPQDRGQVFRARVLNSVLTVLIPYAVCELIGMICVFAVHLSPGKVLPMLLTAFVFNCVYFLLMYAVCVLAVMMTGRAVTGVLGMGVFMAYAPAAAILISLIPEQWFDTYSGGAMSGFYRVLLEGSPISQAAFAVRDWIGHFPVLYGEKSIVVTALPLLRVLLALVAAVLLLLLCNKLLKMRPMERAGEAMAFEKTQSPIRILLTAVAALAGMAFMKELGRGIGWVIFWTVAAVVLSHLIIELLYKADVRRIFSHKIELAVMTALSVGLALLLWTDAFGYDTYLPAADNVKAAQIDFSIEDQPYQLYAETFYSNGFVFRYFESGDWRTVDESENEELWSGFFRLDAENGGIALAQEIAQTGIDECLLAKKNARYTAANGRDVAVSTLEAESAEGEEPSVQVRMIWQLGNGKTKARNYFIPVSRMETAYASLYNDARYKEYAYPLLTAPENAVSGIAYDEGGYKQEINETAKERILAVYMEELRAQTFEERGDAYPVGVLRLYLNEAYLKTLGSSDSNMLDWIREDLSLGSHPALYVRYPVYASFENTISLLKKEGIEVEKANDYLEEASSLQYSVNYYDAALDRYYGYEGTLTDEEDLAFVRGRLYPSDNLDYNAFGMKVLGEISFHYSIGDEEQFLVLPDTEECRAFAERLKKEAEYRGPG